MRIVQPERSIVNNGAQAAGFALYGGDESLDPGGMGKIGLNRPCTTSDQGVDGWARRAVADNQRPAKVEHAFGVVQTEALSAAGEENGIVQRSLTGDVHEVLG
jgi:hypothetical protein